MTKATMKKSDSKLHEEWIKTCWHTAVY